MLTYHEDRNTIFQKLDWRLRFRDPQLQEDFFQFCRYAKLVFILKLSVFGANIVVALSSIYTFFYNQTIGEWLFALLNLLAALVSVTAGSYIIYDCSRKPNTTITTTTTESSLTLLNHTEKRQLQFVANIQTLYYMTVLLWFSCFTYRSFFFQDCSSFPDSIELYLMGWHCGYNHSDIPVYTMPVYVFIPIAIILVLNEIHVDFVVFWYIVNFVSFIAYATYVHNITYLWSASALLIFIVIICIEMHLFRIGNFLSHRKLKETLLENERMHKESKAAELRHMIGNLAHDLKTPLSSFMVGIDMIQSAVNDLEITCRHQKKQQQQQENDITTTLEGSSTLINDMMKNIHFIQQCFKNVHNTHTFMLMTINRCIDYTKASKGLKLSPKYDTLDLMETLHMPLECMSNIQEKIKIELLPFMTEQICSHIITDKQWLQENILCLLSNAVKYSAEGTVTIRILLQEIDFAAELLLLEQQANEKKAVEEEEANLGDDLSKSEKENESVAGGGGSQKSVYSISSLLTTIRMSTTVTASQIYPTMLESQQSNHQINFDSFDLTNTNNNELLLPLTSQSRRNSQSSSAASSRKMSFGNNNNNRLSTNAAAMITHRLRFEIEDNGIGLTEEAMQNLFIPFQRAQRLAGGTGLGLYSLAMRMEALKGKYGVAHRRDKKQGSLFWFEIPYRPDPFTASLNQQQQQYSFLASPSLAPAAAAPVVMIEKTFDGTPGKAPAIAPSSYSHHHLQQQQQHNLGGIGQKPPIINNLHIFDKIDDDTAFANNTVNDKCSSLPSFEAIPQISSTFPSALKPLDSAKILNEAVALTATVTAANANANVINSSTSATIINHNNKESFKVLVVDDSPAIMKMVTMMLRLKGHEAITAENGSIALNLLEKEWQKTGKGFDVILMDLQMPVMDGLETTRRIRFLEQDDEKQTAIYHQNHQLIVGMSANSDHETMEASYVAGMDDFMVKPFHMEAFLEIVRKYYTQT